MEDDLIESFYTPNEDFFVGIIIYVNYSINSIVISNNCVPGNATFTMFKKEFEKFIKNYRSKEIEIADRFGTKVYQIKDIDIALFDMEKYFDNYNIRIKTV